MSKASDPDNPAVDPLRAWASSATGGPARQTAPQQQQQPQPPRAVEDAAAGESESESGTTTPTATPPRSPSSAFAPQRRRQQSAASSQPGAYAVSGPMMRSTTASTMGSDGGLGILPTPQLRRSEAIGAGIDGGAGGAQGPAHDGDDVAEALPAFLAPSERSSFSAAAAAGAAGDDDTSGGDSTEAVATVLHAEVSISTHGNGSTHGARPSAIVLDHTHITLDGVVIDDDGRDGAATTPSTAAGSGGPQHAASSRVGVAPGTPADSGRTADDGKGASIRRLVRCRGGPPRAIVAWSVAALMAVIVASVVCTVIVRRASSSPPDPAPASTAAADTNDGDAADPTIDFGAISTDPGLVATMDLLIANGVDAERLGDVTTAQFRALYWLAFFDDDGITDVNNGGTDMSSSSSNLSPERRIVQRFVAATLLFGSTMSAFTVPEGRRRIQAEGEATAEEGHLSPPLKEFMRGHECGWNEVPTDFSYGLLGGFECQGYADGGGKEEITSIYFGEGFAMLTGTMPDEIGLLPGLKHLFVTDSDALVGSIPRSVSKLGNLERLALTRTGLNGTIPDLTSSAPTLRQLVLSSNSLTGTVPDDIGTLSELVFLSIDDNALSGTVPASIADLSQMTILGLSRNKLVGTIPPLDGARRLMSVGLGVNRFTGTIPPLWADTLRYLFLEGNELSGGIPPELGSLSELRALFLHSNYLGGPIPGELGNNVQMQYLELGDNVLSGTVPRSFENLVELASLSLANNDLTGDSNFLCAMNVPKLSTDCEETDPGLTCDCCRCCDDGGGCGQYPNAYALSGKFFVADCCVGNECGDSCVE